MRIEIYVAVDKNGNYGVGDSTYEATSGINLGQGPELGPVAVACFSVEMNAPKLIEGQLVVVPDGKAQTIQPQVVEVT